MLKQVQALQTILAKTRENYTPKPLHPAVVLALQHSPTDWHLIALQNPTPSTDGRLAYTQSEEKRSRNVTTVTSPGKYLKRHWPSLPDHIIRDLLAQAEPHTYEILTTKDEIIHAVQNGPQTCMKWEEDYEVHPYEAYDPEYGWKLAIRKTHLGISARCLINDETFVRSFKAHGDDPKSTLYSYPDQALEIYLQDLGYQKQRSWPDGLKLAKLQDYDHFLPYIDGDIQTVSEYGNYYRIDSDGDLKCDNTDGSVEEEDLTSCYLCGERTRETFDYSHHCEQICECCVEDCTSVRGRRGYYYYIDDESAIEGDDGRQYDRNYLSHNLRVEDIDGIAIHEDNAIPTCDGEHVHVDRTSDENDPAEAEFYIIDGEAHPAKDCNWCEYNEKWLLDEVTTLQDGKHVKTEDVLAYMEDLEPQVRKNLLGNLYEEFYATETSEET